jgi:hypothetical protein
MPVAIVTALTGFHYTLGIVVFLVAVGLLARWDYRRLCRREANRRREPEQPIDIWAGLPQKWEAPAAESHLGKTRLGERKAA